MFCGYQEGDFLLPKGGAKLASLFDLDQAASQGNESFQFRAPKQPKKTPTALSPSPQKPAPTPSVLLATAVHAFHFVNGQYTKQGKVGAAILGNHPTREYMILLYGSQQKPITTAKIHLGFSFTVQPGNYGTFYDDQRHNWSLMFDSEKAGVDFCKELCVARWNSETTVDTLLTQDLLLGEGQAVDYGDTVEVTFTGWLLQNHNIGQMFDSNVGKDKLLRVKLGTGKVIKGLEDGMLGMQKTGRRLHIVPPTLGYGSKGIPNRVPSSSTLVYNVEIRRVKFAKDSGSERQSGGLTTNSPSPSVDSLGFGMSPQSQPPTSIPAEPRGKPLNVKSNSRNEQLMQLDTAKAKLISHMAKMGQPILPFPTGAIPAQPDHSDSKTEVGSIDLSESHPSHHCLLPQPVQMSAAPPVHAVPEVVVPTAAQQPVFMETVVPQAVDCGGSSHAFQPYPSFQSAFGLSYLGQFHPHHAVSYQAPSDVTSFLMTEVRQHNTEIEQAVGKVADKINLLVSKVDELQKHGGGNSLGLSSVSMETAMSLHNIQRITQENLFLKEVVLKKSTRVEEQNWKIRELLEQNQRWCVCDRCMEQSALLLEQRKDVLKTSNQQDQTSLLEAEQDKPHLTEYLAASSTLVSKLQLESSSLQCSVSDLQTQLSQALQDRESHSTQFDSLERLVEGLRKGEGRAQAQWRTEKLKRKEMQLRIANTEEELQGLRAGKGNLDKVVLDVDWQQGGYEKELHSRELAEITQQRDILARTLSELQEQYMAAQSRAETSRKQLEMLLVEQEKRHAQQPSQDAMAEQVKRVMNRLFHSLRGEFGLHQSYQGSDVLGVMLSTIKSVTLDLLTAHNPEEEDKVEEEKWTKAVEQNRRVDDDKEMNRSIQEKEDSGVTQTAWTSIVRALWSEAQVEDESINSEGLENKAEDTPSTSREETPSKTGSENGLTPSSLMVLIEEMSCQIQPLAVQIDQSKQMEVVPPPPL
ncbi:FK506-binding protein 15 isoform X7 [Salmo salar]|uniref:peptidylprolyl isomerase n=1 Tax=Salmo salar TaxID=8030 RepID=A0ABM3CRV4_SALSA|nr:FK506-binding protein 15 isoform X7 [Salmo salar]|eukprot:XP_013997865.1 PREDICTED: FK506-binding protein 15 isoform X1 [Salmo salar]